MGVWVCEIPSYLSMTCCMVAPFRSECFESLISGCRKKPKWTKTRFMLTPIMQQTILWFLVKLTWLWFLLLSNQLQTRNQMFPHGNMHSSFLLSANPHFLCAFHKVHKKMNKNKCIYEWKQRSKRWMQEILLFSWTCWNKNKKQLSCCELVSKQIFIQMHGKHRNP